MKYITYPIGVILFFGLLTFIVLATTRKVGLQTNTSNMQFELEDIKTFNIWRDKQTFLVSPNGDKSIYDSSIPPVEDIKELTESNLFSEKVLFILRFDSGKEDLNEFLHQLSSHELKQVLIASPNDSTLRNLRSLESNFYYAPSIKNLLKWSVFSRLYIEPIYDLKADFIYVDKRINSLLNPALRSEVARRGLILCEFTNKLTCS